VPYFYPKETSEINGWLFKQQQQKTPSILKDS
jgi:hypothetical protein